MLDEPLDWRWYVGVGVAYFAVTTLLGTIGQATPALDAGLAGTMFVALGALCLANWSRCGSIHCVVSGPPYLALGAGTLLVAAGALSVGLELVWAAFVLVVVVAFGIEWILERRDDAGAA